MKRETTAWIAALLLVAAPAPAQREHDMAGMNAASSPPLFSDLGSWTHKVSATPEAQKYFDQGLRLYYGFNHAEAIRAFRESARLDPACAMAWWGVAAAAGPNINMPMDEAGAKIANEAIARAKALAHGVDPADQAYIAALGTRYSTDPSASRAVLDSAYCSAMRTLAKSRPDDADAGALFAESILDLNPWNQWTHDGKPNPGTLEAVATLEDVLAKHPEHPGANHFYIHAVEASNDPARALASAKRLETLVPGAGHLVHMPSHIYARTGRYADALERNKVAVAVDEKYIADQKPEGAYPLMYYNHNIQFIMFSAMMEGRSGDAIAAARKITGNVPAEMISQMSMLEMVPPSPVLMLVRFGRWDEALKEPLPPSSERYASGICHYARGVALAAKGRFEPAMAELDSVRAMAAAVPADMLVSINLAAPLLRLAASALAGEIATRKGRTDEGVRMLTLAVATEDSLHYDEPPTWCYPVRHTLGAALLRAKRATEAEAVYRDDLLRHPENGWSLYGLAQALRGQGRTKEAGEVEARFRRAWANADVKLAASAY
jgi:tetratricopeptide (TPR) repeat protein